MDYIIDEFVCKAEKIGFFIEAEDVFYELGGKTPSLYIQSEALHGLDIQEEELTGKIGVGRFSYQGGGVMGCINTSDCIRTGSMALKNKFQRLLDLFVESFIELEKDYLSGFDSDGEEAWGGDADGMVRIN